MGGLIKCDKKRPKYISKSVLYLVSALQKVANFNFPEGLLNDFRGAAQCPVDRSWCAQRCCDGAATESLLRRSCADQLPRAHSARRVSTRRAELRESRKLNEEPASFPPGLIQISMVVAHSPRPPPWPRNLQMKELGVVTLRFLLLVLHILCWVTYPTNA